MRVREMRGHQYQMTRNPLIMRTLFVVAVTVRNAEVGSSSLLPSTNIQKHGAPPPCLTRSRRRARVYQGTGRRGLEPIPTLGGEKTVTDRETWI
jgi:hypothetical protein